MFQNKDFLNILPLISVVFVSILSLISNIVIIRFSQRENLTSKIIEKYFEVRNEICEKLSDLANLKEINIITEEKISESREQVSKMFYKYYDFLPDEVLYELICLYCTLNDRGHRLYRINKRRLELLNKNDLENYVKESSLLKNTYHSTYVMLNSKDINIRKAVSINAQARKVLDAMNDFFSLESLTKFVRNLKRRNQRFL